MGHKTGIINLSSSPEPPDVAGPSTSRGATARRPVAHNAPRSIQTVFISDDDDEIVVYSPANAARRSSAHRPKKGLDAQSQKGKGKAAASEGANVASGRRIDTKPSASVKIPQTGGANASSSKLLAPISTTNPFSAATSVTRASDPSRSTTPTTPSVLTPERPYTPMDVDPPVIAPVAAPSKSAEETRAELVNSAVVKILEVVPDVDVAYLRGRLEANLQYSAENLHERVLHNLFEDPTYPKVDPRKRKIDNVEADAEESTAKEVKVDYGSADRPFRGGQHYHKMAMEALVQRFPDIPDSHIEARFNQHNMLYAPTALKLFGDRRAQPLPYKPVSAKTRSAASKGKGVAHVDEELEREQHWLESHYDAGLANSSSSVVLVIDDDDEAEASTFIECGCCFGEYPWNFMVQCEEAHLFCMDCARQAAEQAIGERKTDFLCMDQSGCKAPFPIVEIRRFLSKKSFNLWERIKAEKSIEDAGIEGLESCPFCPYSVVIEAEEEKLFRCENPECMQVTCRKCKKQDHVPKSCAEVDEDKILSVRHVIEEAMTAALTRRCPQCDNAFVKSEGCNKMTCNKCRTLSCYVCRQVVTGYEHFHRGRQRGTSTGECHLWDPVEHRGHDEVATAAREALAKFKREHPEAADTEIDIEPLLPGAPAVPHVPRPDLVAAGLIPNLPAGAHRHAPQPRRPVNIADVHALHADAMHRIAAILAQPGQGHAPPPPQPAVNPQAAAAERARVERHAALLQRTQQARRRAEAQAAEQARRVQAAPAAAPDRFEAEMLGPVGRHQPQANQAGRDVALAHLRNAEEAFQNAQAQVADFQREIARMLPHMPGARPVGQFPGNFNAFPHAGAFNFAVPYGGLAHVAPPPPPPAQQPQPLQQQLPPHQQQLQMPAPGRPIAGARRGRGNREPRAGGRANG